MNNYYSYNVLFFGVLADEMHCQGCSDTDKLVGLKTEQWKGKKKEPNKK